MRKVIKSIYDLPETERKVKAASFQTVKNLDFIANLEKQVSDLKDEVYFLKNRLAFLELERIANQKK